MTTAASWSRSRKTPTRRASGSQGREDYEAEDVEYYFNYMGILADEGSNDRHALLNAGNPIDVISSSPRRRGRAEDQEILEAGADPKVTDMDGKTPMDLAEPTSGEEGPRRQDAPERDGASDERATRRRGDHRARDEDDEDCEYRPRAGEGIRFDRSRVRGVAEEVPAGRCSTNLYY